MALDVGDAVLTFLGDTTQLDQAFARVVDNADKSMSTAADSVDQVGDSLKKVSFELDATGSNAAYAGGEIKDSMANAAKGVDGLSGAMAIGQQGAVKLGEVTTLAGTKTRESMYQARGEGMLLGEMFGVHLPRHVMSFLAELPGVGAALSGAFSATAVIFLIDTVVKLIEKHEQLAVAARHAGQDSESLAIKQNDLVLSLKAANLQIEDQIAKLEGRPERNLLAIALIAVKKSADELAASFSADFAKMDVELEKQEGLWANLTNSALAALAAATPELVAAGWEKSSQAQIAANYLVQESIKQVTAAEDKLNEARRKLSDQDPKKNMEAWKAAAGAVAIAAGNVQAAADAAHAAVKNVDPDAHKLLANLTDMATRAKGEWESMALKITEAGLEARKANQEIANAGAGRDATKAKQDLAAQIAQIDAWKAAQHAAYESGKTDLATWLAAEVHAADAAAIAHEDYLKRILVIYTRSGETLKAQAAAQELADLQTKNAADATDKLAIAMDHHRAATHKVAMEYGKLVEAGVEKDFNATAKAAERLTRAEEELLKAETKLAGDKVSQHFKDQEAAITKLAAMHLISERQKNDRLALLEKEQADTAIAILTDQLAKEKAVMAAAETKVTAAQSNPFFTPAQVLDLEVNLKKAQIAVTNTEAAIVQAKEKYNKASEALDKGYYGRALALAMASGKELLAEQLKENHASLLSAQAKLAEAKARGANTTALQHEITALKQNEQQLQRQANGNKQAIAAEMQLTKAQLLATQAILADAKARGLDTAAIEKHIRALKDEVAELQKTKQATNNLATATDKLKQDTKAAATEMLSSLSTAFEGIITGQQSFGKAMEDATFKMIGKMAMSWGEYFAAKGIADIFMDPPLGGAELAASAALFAMSGVMSGLASGSGSSSHSSVNNVSSSNNPTGVSQSSMSGGGSTQTVSVTKLAAGGIVSRPTMFMAGDGASGGSAAEAIIPLTDPAALARISNALLSAPTLRAASAGMTSTANLAAASGAAPMARFDDATITKLGDRIGSHLDSSGTQGDTTHIHVNVKGSVDHGTIAGLVQKINRKVQNRQLTLNASNSQRLTRRSQ